MRNKVIGLILGCLLGFILVLPACGAPATTTQTTTSVAPANSTAAPTTSAAAAVPKPTGELVAALASFGNENFLPWLADPSSSNLNCIVYDVLIYWDEINRKFIPGLAESWDLAPDALTLTYHVRKGVQWQDGWGEFTAEDIKYNFEKHASPESVGKTTQARAIDKMEIPDPYTLVVHFRTPQPTFFMEFSYGGGGALMGLASKKYVETAGEDAASQKPIGTGPFKLVESQLGDSYKFEAVENHWRVVPEFKTLIVRSVPEISTVVAMLKTKEIDLANISSEQIADLKTAGIDAESNPNGGSIFLIGWGGLCLPADFRYKADYFNKDPWTDVRVRKAMAISIDRQAISNAIFSGAAPDASVPLHTADMNKYQYPYDPAAAKQLLADAGYPNGFSFQLVSFTIQGIPEAPRVVEALAGYWQQIGLQPQIITTERTTYLRDRNMLKNLGKIAPQTNGPGPDMLDKAALYMMPNSVASLFMDEGSYAIWKEGNAKVNADEREAYAVKLNQYYFENVGPLPVVKLAYCYAWNPAKLAPFPHTAGIPVPYYLEYVRHAQPLNTFRLFTPWAGR